VVVTLADGRLLALSEDVAELYDPTTDRWRKASTPETVRSDFSATLYWEALVSAAIGWWYAPQIAYQSAWLFPVLWLVDHVQ
jgi:hypothetical protein